MRSAAILAVLACLPACAVKRRQITILPALETPDRVLQPVTAAWLVGVWLPDATRDDLDRGACASGQPISYAADGISRFWEGDARWRLDKDVLIETITAANEDIIDPAELGIGTTTRTRIRRIGPNEAALYHKGRWLRMLRCRPGD